METPLQSRRPTVTFRLVGIVHNGDAGQREMVFNVENRAELKGAVADWAIQAAHQIIAEVT